MDVDVDDFELQAQIASLADRIDRHKAGESYGANGYSPYPTSYYPQQHYHQPHPSYRGYHHEAPRSRGRGGAPLHRHRTLIINNTASPDPNTLAQSSETGWISKNDRHMQLINSSVYEQKSQERTQAMEQTRVQRQGQKQEKEKAMIKNHLHSNHDHCPQQTTNTLAHVTTVNGIRFLVAEGGSKLIKTDEDESNKLHVTPKRTIVGGVSFHRSKHGNLYRAGLVKIHREQTGVPKSQKPCLHFSTTGSCPKGPNCRYTHDPAKVGMCKDFLQKGECRAGDYCDLSHNPTAERVPACLHFLRGSCTNPDCRYAHVRVNPGAPVCQAFATYGFCSKGIACTQRHVHECPDYANKGFCRNEKCHLPHVDRAGQLRKAATMVDDDDDGKSDFSSEPDHDSDDVDSDEIDEELFKGEAEETHEMSQQTDYVRL